MVCAIFSGIVATLCVLVARQSESKEFCHNDDFEAECPEPEEVILMTSALYGRMSLGECVKQDFGFLGCYSDVIAYTHERCSGRKSCLIRIPDQILDRTKPCNEDLKSYLDTTYDCIRVAIPETESCELVSKTDELTGYLSNIVLPVSSQRCGSTTSPWTITVLHGQRVNITLLDFSSTINYDEMGVDTEGESTTVGMETTTMTTTTTTPTGGCDQYAAFHEASSGPSSSEKSFLCGSRMVSFSQAFLSSSNTMKVTLFHRTDHDYNFLLKYEAVGCSDVLQTPSNVWFRRDHDHMTVGCLMSEITWRLTCVQNHWEGTTANCSHTGLKIARREDGLPLLSMGASILIILSVSLGIGLVVLLFGLYYMKRKHERNAFGVQMRDLKPLQPDSSASYAAGAAAGVSSSSSPGVLPRSSGPVSAGPTASASASSAFEPSVRLNVTRIDPSIRRGKGCLASTACNAEDGSDYEYVWNMSPATPVSSAAASKRILPKLRPKQQQNPLHLQQQQQQQHLHQRPETMLAASTSRPPLDLSNRPDLVSKLEGADDAMGRSNSGSSSGGPGGFPIPFPIPVAAAGAGAAAGIQCTCRLEDRRKATTTSNTAATSSRSTDDVLGSPQRIRVKPRQGSGEEATTGAVIVPAPPLPPHRSTPDSRPSSATTTPTSAAGVTTIGPPRPEVMTDGCRRVCRHCGHAVLDGGSGSVRFAPGTGTTAIIHDVPGFGSVAKRSVAAGGEDATAMKRGFNASIVAIPQQHKH